MVLTDLLDLGTSDKVLLPVTEAPSSNITLDFSAWSGLDIDLVGILSLENFGWGLCIESVNLKLDLSKTNLKLLFEFSN